MGTGSSGLGKGGGAKAVVRDFNKRINKASTIDELDSIIEELANNEVISNEQYTTLYAKALKKAELWQPTARMRSSR